MWHASVAILGSVGPVPWSRARVTARHTAKAIAITLLDGVGEGDTRRDRSDLVLHARRKLNAAELAQLDPAWCAIEPFDIAGDGIPW